MNLKFLDFQVSTANSASMKREERNIFYNNSSEVRKLKLLVLMKNISTALTGHCTTGHFIDIYTWHYFSTMASFSP